MSKEHPGGYLKNKREPIHKRDPEERKDDFEEVWEQEWDEDHLKSQGERCMSCGTPACMSGCPIGNIIPDWNDLVYRDDWKRALERLHATNNFPEFTGYNCPAPCENTCTLNYNDDPVTIKSIERAIVDKGWEEGWIQPDPPEERTDEEVAIVGSGPAGLAAAQQLNRAGHHVTVYERDQNPGGLMRYGIPDAKFSKKKVERRIDQLREEGITFECGVEVGEDIPAEKLNEEYDAACIAVGSQKPIELPIEGIDLDGIHYAMEYLPRANPGQNDGWEVPEEMNADGKSVVVLGGGDTGADCVGTAHRQGAAQVVQIELLPRPPEERPEGNQWPDQPQTYEKSYSQEEGGVEEYCVDTQQFHDTDGDGTVDELRAHRVEWEQGEDGWEKEVVEEDMRIDAEMVLVAAGFQGPEETPFDPLDLEMTEHGTFETEDHQTNVENVFAAGDANSGPSLIVWAIGDGRDAARDIDEYLMGETSLPASLETDNPPVVSRR